VHVIGVSSQAAGHKTLVPQADRRARQARRCSEVLVVVGGVIPAQDYDFLKKAASPRSTAPGHQHPGRRGGNPLILRQRSHKRALNLAGPRAFRPLIAGSAPLQWRSSHEHERNWSCALPAKIMSGPGGRRRM